MQTGAIGHDFDFDVLLFLAEVLDDILGVVEHKVHDVGVILIDVDGQPMRFVGGGRDGRYGEQHGDNGGERKGYFGLHGVFLMI
jgi:hypothetical protein